MISGKNAVVVFLLTLILTYGKSADAGCPFLEPVAPLSVKDSVPVGRAFVSLAWVARDFGVTVRSADTTDSCVFDLDKYKSGNKIDRTGLFSFEPGKYRVSYQHRHAPGTHASTALADTVVELRAGTWYIARFNETSIDHKGKSVMKLVRAKAWRLDVQSTAKEKVIKHAAGERPGVKTIVLVGIVLVTLLFGGLMVYAR
jgi:hypothetical protein